MGASVLQWIWTFDTYDGADWSSMPPVIVNNPAELWYPGTEYVDWVGIDGYNMADTMQGNHWITAHELFLNQTLRRVRQADGSLVTKSLKALERAKAYGKPIAIPEWGSVPCTPGTCAYNACNIDSAALAAKEAWIEEALALFREYDVKMLCYFNTNKQD